MFVVPEDRPLDPVTIAILRSLHQITEQLEISYAIVGATARDILMTHVFGIRQRRATQDVDFAVALDSWSQFDALKRDFIASGEFEALTNEAHRLFYKPSAFRHAFPIDLIPFGGLEQSNKSIAWPPDMSIVMTVAGYEEASASSLQVQVTDDLVINIVSLPALAALKLIAWNDRSLRDPKDAEDLYFLLRHYHEAGNSDRLYNDESHLLEQCRFDLELAGAALLGKDAKTVLTDETCDVLNSILGDRQKFERLIVHMDRQNESPDSLEALLDRFAAMLR